MNAPPIVPNVLDLLPRLYYPLDPHQPNDHFLSIPCQVLPFLLVTQVSLYLEPVSGINSHREFLPLLDLRRQSCEEDPVKYCLEISLQWILRPKCC